jgi:hypothetical protein
MNLFDLLRKYANSDANSFDPPFQRTPDSDPFAERVKLTASQLIDSGDRDAFIERVAIVQFEGGLDPEAALFQVCESIGIPPTADEDRE